MTLAPDVVPPTHRNSIWNLTGSSFESRYGDSPPWSMLARFGRTWRGMEVGTLTLINAQSEVYEFVQSFPRWCGEKNLDVAKFEKSVDRILFQNRAPYRFADHKLVPIVSDEERAVVEQATKLTGKYAPASEHLAKALTKFSERPTPDYENAAKEAASVLESALKIATGESNVARATQAFRESYGVHRSLSESASKLFGYASDRDGVRHGKTEPGSAVEFDEAKLVILSASAWVSFIATKAP